VPDGPHGQARARLLAMKGRPVTLRRGDVAVPLTALLTRYAPDALVGNLRQGDARCEILAAPLADAGFDGAPRNPDEIRTANNSWTVQHAAPIYEGADLIGYSLTLRGS